MISPTKRRCLPLSHACRLPLWHPRPAACHHSRWNMSCSKFLFAAVPEILHKYLPLVKVYITIWKTTMLLMGRSTISMAIFHSYVKLPEATSAWVTDPLFWYCDDDMHLLQFFLGEVHVLPARLGTSKNISNDEAVQKFLGIRSSRGFPSFLMVYTTHP